MLQTFSKFVIEADYFLNKSFIARNLCVNKDKPSMNCCGKCFLKKQLAKDNKQQPASLKKERNEVGYVLTNPQNIIEAKYFILKPFVLNGNASAVASFPRTVFRPPSA